MRVSIILVSSAALVAAAPVPGVGETIWKGITYIPRKVGACVGACVKGVDEAVTVQIPGAVHGLGDGISAGTRVGKHEAEESMEAFVKGKHAEKMPSPPPMPRKRQPIKSSMTPECSN